MSNGKTDVVYYAGVGGGGGGELLPSKRLLEMCRWKFQVSRDLKIERIAVKK